MIAAVVIVACAVASFLNAVAAVLQRRAAGTPHPSRLFSRNLISEISRNEKWLKGMGIQVVASLITAVALYWGSLVLVEPLLTTDLVFLMLILHYRFRVGAGLREWGGVAAICGGLTSLLVAANPQSGDKAFDWLGWTIAAGVVIIGILAAAAIMRRASLSSLRAAIGGVACGLNLSLSAGLIKLVYEQWENGLGAVFTSWQIYAFLLSALLSIIVIQSTFAAGPIAISQPSIEISTPLISVAMGVVLFGDDIRTTAAALALEICGAIIIAAGIILLGRSSRIQRSPA
jgi:hypothetical protein